MGKLEFDRDIIEETMDRIVERTMRMDMTWDWPCGVAYYGIAEAYEATGKQQYLDRMKERVDELIDLGLPGFTVNTCAMGHVLLTLYQHTGSELYRDIIEAKVDYRNMRRFGSETASCSIPCRRTMISRNSAGRTRFLWPRCFCCGQACCLTDPS